MLQTAGKREIGDHRWQRASSNQNNGIIDAKGVLKPPYPHLILSLTSVICSIIAMKGLFPPFMEQALEWTICTFLFSFFFL